MGFRVKNSIVSVHNQAKRLCATSLIAFALFFSASRSAHASTDEIILDAAALTQLETQAANAQAREQCFLYAQILHSLTEVAGKQLADGQDEQAVTTFRHIDAITAKLEQAIARDAKRLKNAEMLMEHTAHRLADMLHVTTGDQHEALQSTVTRVNALHTQLLATVFAK